MNLLNLNMKIIKLTIAIVLLFNVSCAYDPPFKSLEIYNNSDDAIYVFFSNKDSITISPKLELFVKDTTGLYFTSYDSIYSPEYRVNARSFSYLREKSVSTSKWIPFTDKDFVNFFFITENTMKNYSWEEIVEKQLYVKKVRYSYKQLEKLKFRIMYKP